MTSQHPLPAFTAPLSEMQPMAVAREGEFLSALEEKFPRIMTNIVRLWGQPAMDTYLYELTIDERGGRLGFPSDVFQDILMLIAVHQELRPLSESAADGYPGWTRLRHLN